MTGWWKPPPSSHCCGERAEPWGDARGRPPPPFAPASKIPKTTSGSPVPDLGQTPCRGCFGGRGLQRLAGWGSGLWHPTLETLRSGLGGESLFLNRVGSPQGRRWAFSPLPPIHPPVVTKEVASLALRLRSSLFFFFFPSLHIFNVSKSDGSIGDFRGSDHVCGAAKGFVDTETHIHFSSHSLPIYLITVYSFPFPILYTRSLFCIIPFPSFIYTNCNIFTSTESDFCPMFLSIVLVLILTGSCVVLATLLTYPFPTKQFSSAK